MAGLRSRRKRKEIKMIELLIMALIFSVLLNIVQALSAEFSKGYKLGMKYAKEWDARIEALERTTYEASTDACCLHDCRDHPKSN